MWRAGALLGVTAALNHSVEHGCSLPSWAAEAALKMICDLLKREKSERRGRAASVIARYRQDYIDMVRWNEVIVLEEKQKTVNQSLIDYASLANTKIYQDEAKRAEWLGRTRSRIFECVSEVLEGTEAFGSPLSIKRSYFEVERNNQHPTKAYRYGWFENSLLERVGIDRDFAAPRKLFTWRKAREGASSSGRRANFIRTRKQAGK
jgi:hypothetical protein